MFLKSSKGNINLSTLLFTFLICIAIALGVAFFHHYNSPSKFLEYKVSDLSDRFDRVSDFPSTANRILNSDRSVSYIKLLDRNGVLEESFGNDSAGNTKRVTINGPGNKMIVLGLKPPDNFKLDTYQLIWSLLIGTALSLLLIFFVFMKKSGNSSASSEAMDKLKNSIDKISSGDYTERIDVSSVTKEDISTLNTYQSFNRMAESLSAEEIEAEAGEVEEIVGDEDTGSEYAELSNGSANGISSEEDISRPDVIMMESHTSESENDDNSEPEVFDVIKPNTEESEITNNNEDEFDLGAVTEEEKDFSPIEEDPEVLEQETDDSESASTGFSSSEVFGEEVSSFKPKIVLPQSDGYPKERNVTVVVAKIDDFESLTQKLESSDLSLFLTHYRKAASQIISSYGGVIEALLQDEIVAIFNAPEEQDNPELRAICASVEVLHELATMAKKRRAEGKEMIAGKIGVGVQSLSYYSDTGVPDSVKNVIKDARYVCENANLWKVYVTSDLHEIVNENVDAKEYEVEGEVLYSITGVEQGIVERDNYS